MLNSGSAKHGGGEDGAFFARCSKDLCVSLEETCRFTSQASLEHLEVEYCQSMYIKKCQSPEDR